MTKKLTAAYLTVATAIISLAYIGITGCSTASTESDSTSTQPSFTLTGNPISATPHGDPIQADGGNYPRYELHIGQSYIIPGYKNSTMGDYTVTPKALGVAHNRQWADLTVTFSNGDVFAYRAYQKIDSETASATLGGRTSILLAATHGSGPEATVTLGIYTLNPTGALDRDSPQRQLFARTKPHGTQSWDIPLNRNFWSGTLTVSGGLGDQSDGDFSVAVAMNAASSRTSSDANLGLSASIDCYPGDSYTVSPVGTFTLKGYTPSGEAPPTDPAKVGYSPGQMRVQLRWS